MLTSTLLRKKTTIASLVAILGLGLSVVGCGPATTPPNQPVSPANEGPISIVDVRDEDFSASLFSLVRDGSRNPKRTGLLVGVVRKQMAHALARFRAGQPERATASVMGALYLIRTDEGRSEMIDATGESALAYAIDYLSPAGDEGSVQALMEMRARALTPASPAHAELQTHLAAIQQWIADTHTGGPLEQLSAEQRLLVSRALVDTRPEAVERAANAVSAWIDRAIEFSIELRQSGKRPSQREAMEASHALESGAAILAALFLRNGDAKAAQIHIEQSGARRVILPEFLRRIKAAAANDDAASWFALAAAFVHQQSEGQNLIIPQPLLDAALWGTALEAYRRDPTNLETAFVLSETLVQFGMSEAVPLLLNGALGQKPSGQALSLSLRLLLNALVKDSLADDFDTARRTFAATAPLLSLADQPLSNSPSLIGRRVEPSSARVRNVMATIELRAGNLFAALPLLRAALHDEPSVDGFKLLAMAERQAGDTSAALADIQRALTAPDARVSLLDIAEAHLIAFGLHRDAGASTSAKTSLDNALKAVLFAREHAQSSVAKTLAERLLGRVLDAYGETKGAALAHERALALAASEPPLLGETMLDAVGRALVRHDLPAARKALKRGLEADAKDEDLIYGGLWLLLLERQVRASTDGTAERALAAAKDRTSWTGKLAAWANGKITDTELAAMAQNAAQRVEASFYAAMAKKVVGDPAAEERLRDVSKSPILNLIEVQLAREMLAPRSHSELPTNVRLP